jgi:hypothetical protein
MIRGPTETSFLRVKHANCDRPSVPSAPLEEDAGNWLIESIALEAADEHRLIALVRAKVRSSENVTDAERLRERLSRLHDRYEMDKTMTKAAYRDQLRALETAIRAAEGVDGPSMSAVALVRSFGKTYAAASATQKQKIWQLCFDEVVTERGMLVAVRPKPDIAPLFAAACLTPRSRPDSNRRSRP